MTDLPGVEPFVLPPDLAAKADDLERRIAEGDPTLVFTTLDEFTARYGAERTQS